MADFESDEEMAAINAVITSKSKKSKKKDTQGVEVVVMGEASESEEEIDQGASASLTEPTEKESIGNRLGSLSLSLSTSGSSFDISKLKSPGEQEPLKYNTLLHKKLRERNQILKKHMEELVYQPLQTSIKEMTSVAQQLLKSQVLIQDVGVTMRQMTTDMLHLECKLGTLIENGHKMCDIKICSEPSVLYL